MAFSISSISGYLMNWIINPLMWLILILVFVGGLALILYIRKRRRFIYPCAEVVSLGETNFNMNIIKAGYFGKKSYLRGLWWTGESVMKTSDGDVVHYFSTDDFKELNGERAVFCYRDPIRQNILVPLSHLKITNKDLIAKIAPADYTDVAVSIVEDATNEITDWKDKLIQFGAWALVVVFSLVAIIVIVQMVKNGQKEAADLLLQAGKEGTAACAEVCHQAVAAFKGG